MENRYEGILRRHNDEIIASCSIGAMRFVLAHEFQRLYRRGMRVLEIGCGEGDSAEPLLRASDASMMLLDVSAQMIARCKRKLAKYARRTSYVCADAMEFLCASAKYEIIESSWTVHNFLISDQRRLFSAIYERLPRGGTFLLMDKVYPRHGGRELLDMQIRRYRYLDAAVAKAIIAHEERDYLPQYRMEEASLTANLHDIGFRSIRIADRCERDIVLVAQK